MEFLGHVSKEGSRVDPTKIQEVRGWTQPTSPNLILEFMRLTSYYIKYIQSFSAIAASLSRLARQSVSS